jgi:hypothetical protein
MVQTRNKKVCEKKYFKKFNKIKKSIKFNDNNIKDIYYTYSSSEYDRTSIEIGDDFNYKANNTFNNDLNDYLNNNFDNIDILKDICDLKYEIDLLTYFKNN